MEAAITTDRIIIIIFLHGLGSLTCSGIDVYHLLLFFDGPPARQLTITGVGGPLL